MLTRSTLSSTVLRLSPKRLSLVVGSVLSAAVVPAIAVTLLAPTATRAVAKDTQCLAEQFTQNGYAVMASRSLQADANVVGYQRGVGSVTIKADQKNNIRVEMDLTTAAHATAIRPLIASIARNCAPPASPKSQPI
jgi:hypothetical protein